MTRAFSKLALVAAASTMALSSIPAQAQFRGLFRDAQRGAQAAEGCESNSTGDTARGIIGGLLGGAAGRTARRAGLGSFVPVSQFESQLTKEIACKLNAEEQAQAAEATEVATTVMDDQGNQTPPEVGRSASWESDTRDDVSGRSTVTSRDVSSSEDCITVTDVIIVEGEETRAEKRMCRLAGSPRYTIVV